MKGIFYQASPLIKFIFSLFAIFFSFFFMYVIGILTVQFGFKVNIIQNPELLQDFQNYQAIKLLKFLQLIQSVGLFVIPPFIIAFFIYHSVSDFLRIRKKTGIYTILLSLVVILAYIPFSNLLSYVNNQLNLPSWLHSIEQWMRTSEANANQLTLLFLKADDIYELLYNILLIAIIPAIGEELLFRGVFQRLFTEWFKNIHWGIWFSAILFSAIHFQFFGFLPRLFLGVVFGYLLELTGSIWIPIATHLVNNLVGVLMAYFYSADLVVNQPTQTLSLIEVIYALLGAIIGSLCFWLIARKANRVL
ncbi:MAG: CPBP family intramembrane metalloprotease [Bacteroidales bacterium]|nr:CPBP family intramembrane metalloprotease [Bacteroidales bacterium]